MNATEHIKNNLPHEPMDPRCGFNDGFRLSFLTRLLMGLICNTCRSFAIKPGEFTHD